MLRFFACLAIALFALACSGDKKGPSTTESTKDSNSSEKSSSEKESSAKGAPTAEDIKKDPLAAADKLVEYACACKDEACIDKLMKNEDLMFALKEYAAKGPKEAKEVAEKMDAFAKKMMACLGRPTAEDIKKMSPWKAAESFAEAACACKDKDCLTKLEDTAKALGETLAEKAKADPEGFKATADKIDASMKKAMECGNKIAK